MTHRGRLVAVVLALGAATAISACGWGPSRWPPEGTYAVSGVVTEITDAGAVPVRGIAVSGWGNMGRTWTDSSGRYQWMGVQPGVKTIRIEVGPFETVTQTVNVTADSVVDFRLVRRPRFTLSGFVTEETATGLVPLAGVDVEVVVCPPQINGSYHSFVTSQTDARGFYSVPEMCDGRTMLFASKPGYGLATSGGCEDHGLECHWVTIAGDTRLDLRLGKR